MGNFENVLKYVALVLIIVGAINWGLVGAFNFNLVSTLFGDFVILTRLIYVLIGVAGLYKIYLVAKK